MKACRELLTSAYRSADPRLLRGDPFSHRSMTATPKLFAAVLAKDLPTVAAMMVPVMVSTLKSLVTWSITTRSQHWNGSNYFN
jgi:hypothetical protein